MSSHQVERIVETYRALAKIPALVSAELYNNGTIRSVWSQRNLERGKSTKFLKLYHLTKQNESHPLVIDISNELLSKTSPSENLRAVLREVDTKQYLEIWNNTSLVNNVDLAALEVHGNVYTDGEFSTFEWSNDEKKVLYVAEEKPPKTEPFYKRKPKKDKIEQNEQCTKGEEYLFRQDWGEQLVGKKRSVLVEYTLASDTIKVLEGIPDELCPAQAIYAPDGTYVVGVTYKTHPRKLGLIYCSNRPSAIFKLDFNGNYEALSELSGKSVKSPKFTPDGKHLIWLQRAAGGPHASAMTLVKLRLPFGQNQKNPEELIQTVRAEIEITSGPFYGLYNTTFPNRCWASDNRLLLSTVQKNQIDSFIVDIGTGIVSKLQYDEGSQIVLDVKDDMVLVNRRNFLVPDILAYAQLPPKGKENSVSFTEVTHKLFLEQFANITYHYVNLSHENSDPVKNFTAIYIGPKSGSEKQTPLIVFPHGGPHSASVNNFSMEVSLFTALGFAVLMVNYRGSIGAGQDSVEFLPGRIGTSDVADCILATDDIIRKFPWLDSARVALCGGSHGGFLVTHLSGQYPDKFKVVVARNPVIDVASMSIISDIPDWCFVETGHEYTQVGEPNTELLSHMRNVSPIKNAHKVKAPTLLQVGSKDLRVPPAQAIDYYHRLKANGVQVRMNLYDDNHPLGSVTNEIDNLINSILWIDQHISTT